MSGGRGQVNYNGRRPSPSGAPGPFPNQLAGGKSAPQMGHFTKRIFTSLPHDGHTRIGTWGLV
jgi:hypothetical protein